MIRPLHYLLPKLWKLFEHHVTKAPLLNSVHLRVLCLTRGFEELRFVHTINCGKYNYGSNCNGSPCNSRKFNHVFNTANLLNRIIQGIDELHIKSHKGESDVTYNKI